MIEIEGFKIDKLTCEFCGKQIKLQNGKILSINLDPGMPETRLYPEMKPELYILCAKCDEENVIEQIKSRKDKRRS